MSAGENRPARDLVARLERLLKERAELIETLDRLASGEAQSVPPELHERLEQLTRDQERIVADLARLVPPDEGNADSPPS